VNVGGLTGIEVSVNIDVVVDLVAEIVVLVNGAVSDCHGLPTGSGNLIVILCSILNVRVQWIMIRSMSSDTPHL
jgi:hypothetical protein